jgi:hypothetical protein
LRPTNRRRQPPGRSRHDPARDPGRHGAQTGTHGDGAPAPCRRDDDFVNVILQSAQFGASISDALTTYFEEMRTTRALLAQEKANKLPVKMSSALAGLMMPTLLMITLSPVVIRMIRMFSAGGSLPARGGGGAGRSRDREGGRLEVPPRARLPNRPEVGPAASDQGSSGPTWAAIVAARSWMAIGLVM